LPADIAKACLYFASDDSEFVTGLTSWSMGHDDGPRHAWDRKNSSAAWRNAPRWPRHRKRTDEENAMRFGIFYEHQLPRPWNDGDELKLFQNALDQVELADKLGIDNAWEVEHHSWRSTRIPRRPKCSSPPARSDEEHPPRSRHHADAAEL